MNKLKLLSKRVDGIKKEILMKTINTSLAISCLDSHIYQQDVNQLNNKHKY